MAGKLVHVEINAADADRAQGFWTGVFGWEVGPPMSPEMDYRMFQTGEDQGGAIVASDETSAAGVATAALAVAEPLAVISVVVAWLGAAIAGAATPMAAEATRVAIIFFRLVIRSSKG